MTSQYPTSLFSSNFKFIEGNQFGGEVLIANCAAKKIVAEYGSPIFVLDQDDFYLRAKAWQAALTQSFGGGQVYYAANPLFVLRLQSGLRS